MSKKIKILHIIGSLRIGGAENIAMNFIRYIDKSKFQCDYLVFGDEIGEYEEEAIKLGANVIHIMHTRKNYVNYIKNLKDVLRNGNYDVVHSHILLNNGLTLKIAKQVGIEKRLSHSHSTNSGRNETIIYKIYSYVMKKLVKKYSTSILACGHDAGVYLYGDNIFKRKGIIINNGIDIKQYKYNQNIRKQIRKDLDIENKLVIGHVGRLTEVKNHKFLIDIFYELNKYYPESRLLIIGDGKLKDEIKAKINKLDLANKVVMTGTRLDIPSILQAIDVFVFPSLYEGLPVSVIESQAAGIPSIISKNITSDINITDLVTFVSIDDSPKIWVEKIINYVNYNKKDDTEELTKHGFNINMTIKQLEEIYES